MPLFDAFLSGHILELFRNKKNLSEFHMMELGDLDLILTGMGMLDEPMKRLAHKIVDRHLKGVLVYALNQELPEIIQSVLDKVHI